MRRVIWRSSGAVVVLALIVRVAWLALAAVEPVSDSVRYDFFAQRLVLGQGYTEADGRPTAYWPVGPSALYAAAYWLAGPESPARFTAAAVVNLLCGVATVALTIYLGRRWISPRAGVVAGLLLALWPSQVMFTTVLSSETPMLCGMLAGLACWYAERPHWALRAIGAGLGLAAAAYMRPTVLLLPAVLVVSDLALRAVPWRQTLGAAVLTGVVMAGCIAPWTIRNYAVFDAFVPISTNSGSNFWMGNNPQTTGGYQGPPPSSTFGGEVERDRALRAEALAYIRAKPAAFVQRTLVKAVRLHERESIGVGWNEPGLRRRLEPLLGGHTNHGIVGLKLVSNLWWWAVLLLALIGAVRLALSSRPRPLGFLATPVLIWLYFTTVHAVTVVQDRYHFAVAPMMAMCAAIACRMHQTTDNEAQGA